MSTDPLPSGMEVGEYRILERIGSGGFSIVYKGANRWLAQCVAIKEFAPHGYVKRRGGRLLPLDHLGEDERALLTDLRARFKNEARTLLDLATPLPQKNVVQFLGWWESNDTPYLIMRLEEGVTLLQMIKRRDTFGYDEIRSILPGLKDGLEWIHSKGYLHRDIKPGNIMIRRDGEPVLLDLGSMRVLQNDVKTRAVLVTPGYAAPELDGRVDRIPDQRSDIYGLAATLYHVVTKEFPLSAESRSAQLRGSPMHLSNPHKLAAEISKGQYPTDFLVAIDTGMEYDIDRRPKNLDEWFEMLGNADGGSNSKRRASSMPRPRHARRKEEQERTKSFPVLELIGLLLVAVVLVWLWFGGSVPS